jgi:hypothetical protein
MNQACVYPSSYVTHANYTRSTSRDSPPIPSTSSHDQLLIPLATAAPDTAATIWGRIIAFTTIPGHPDSFDASDLLGASSKIHAFNFTRKSLTLVSKSFRVSERAIAEYLVLMAPLGSYSAILFPSSPLDEQSILPSFGLVSM